MIRLEEILKKDEEQTKIPLVMREKLWEYIFGQIFKKNYINEDDYG